MNRRLLLITDMKPDTGFSAARAMNRNKFIYASAYGTFVVASDYNKGGTWAGAVEACAAEGQKSVWLKRLCDEGLAECKRGVYNKASQ